MPAIVRRRRRAKNALSEHEARTRLCELGIDHVPATLMRPLRAFLSRNDLLVGAPLPRITTVTSPLPGEDTTFVAHALTAVLAHDHGTRVCRLDGEWLVPGPRTDRVATSTLTDVLQDESRLTEGLTSPSGQPLLTTLRLGGCDADSPSSVVSANDLRALLDVLSSRFDHIVLEAPGVLVHQNSPVVLHESEAYLLVVRSGAASEANVRAVTALAAPTECLAAVLTDFDRRVPRALSRMLGTEHVVISDPPKRAKRGRR